MLVSIVISSIFQTILFSLIPFVFWLITSRKKMSFLEYIGIKKIDKEKKKGMLIWSSITLLFFLILTVYILYITKGIETATSKFNGLEFKGLLPAIVYASLNTALPEEILFRGFLLKRFSRFGFAFGNIFQSALFGLIHGVLLFSELGLLKAILVILFTGGVAFAMGYINEKKANGSIIPSFIIHMIANLVSSVISLFSLI